MTTTAPPPSPARPSWSAILGVFLAALAVLAGWSLWRTPSPPAPRPASGDLVLEETIDLAEGPRDRRLLAPGPCVFSIDVTSSVDVRVTLGPPLPSTNAAEGGPDLANSTVLRASSGKSVSADVRVYGAGIQVVRVEAESGASTRDRSASLRIRRRAGP